MTLGSTNGYQSNNSQNNQQMWEPNYYSRLRIRNYEDNLGLTFTFWKGTLKVAIAETGSAQEGRNNELAAIYLSPTKAKIFAEAVGRIIADEETFDVYGIDTGSGETRGFMAIGREMGKPFLFIGKVDKDGKYVSSQRFRFNYDYDYLLKVSDLTKLTCKKEYINSTELSQFKELLEDYARTASGAMGAMFYDIGRYEAAKTSNMIRKIAEKVGAVEPFRGGNGGGKNNSFFNGADAEYEAPSANSGSKKSTYQSIDDLEDELG